MKVICLFFILLNIFNYCSSYFGDIRSGVEDYSSISKHIYKRIDCFNNETEPLDILSYDPTCNLYKLESHLSISCKDDTFTASDGHSTSKKEGNREQNIKLLANAYATIKYFPGVNRWYVYLFQVVKISTGNMIVNNNKEHQSFFNTKLKISSQLEIGNKMLVGKTFTAYPETSDTEYVSVDYNNFFSDKPNNHRINNMNKHSTITQKIDGWSVLRNQRANAVDWTFYQKSPLNTLKHSANDYFDWFRDVTKYSNGHYIGKELPKHSTGDLVVNSTLIFEISPYIDSYNISSVKDQEICFNLKYEHFLGDFIIGSIIVNHNSYREVSHSVGDKYCFFPNVKIDQERIIKLEEYKNKI